MRSLQLFGHEGGSVRARQSGYHTDRKVGVSRMRRAIALVAGETAGHVRPALAVADAYRRAHEGVDVLFLGTPGTVGAGLVPARGYPLVPLDVTPLVGMSLTRQLRGAARALAGVARARGVLRRHRARLVIGFGSYVSGSVVIAARTLRMRTALHEANVRPGMANRWLARHVDRAYLSFASAAPHFPAGRRLVTGLPLAGEMSAPTRAPGPAVHRPLRLLAITGSRGGVFLAERMPQLVTIMARSRSIEVLQQSGEADAGLLSARYASAGVSARVMPVIDDMAAAYR